MEGETDTELVSAIERERTMRNLVDMQKKVEQRQQRDRERQLLRVRVQQGFLALTHQLQKSGQKDTESIYLSGPRASVNHTEQKGRGRSARPETHRQAEAPHTGSTTG